MKKYYEGQLVKHAQPSRETCARLEYAEVLNFTQFCVALQTA